MFVYIQYNICFFRLVCLQLLLLAPAWRQYLKQDHTDLWQLNNTPRGQMKNHEYLYIYMYEPLYSPVQPEHFIPYTVFLPNHLDHPQPETLFDGGSKDMLRSSRVDGCDSDPSARPPWEAFCNQRAAEQERKHRWCNGATVGVQAHRWSS